jgi:spore coat polysaccharide biosynthesis protein SpsF
MADYTTEQERFWAGQFGDEYSQRNRGEAWIAGNTALFARVLAQTRGIRTLIEFGANVGLNLRALGTLLPTATMTAVEINHAAALELRAIPAVHVVECSFLEYDAADQFDLVIVKGVLIHVHPDYLMTAYDVMHRACAKYLLLAEYYNPTPVSVSYRGHADKLFKRDFAGEILRKFPDMRLVDYGFVYHGDPNFPQDDLTWFLLEKQRGPA